MAISKIKLPDNSVENIVDSRILGIDSVPTENSTNIITSGGVYQSQAESEEVVAAALNDLNDKIDEKVYGNAKVFYGTCSTVGATAAKVVSCDSFTSADLTPGTLIIVKFDNANTADVRNLTMSVNGTTACNIKKLDGTSITNLSAAGEIRAFPTLFICSGNYWIQANTDQDTTYATITTSEINTGTSTGKRVVSASVLRDNFYTESEVDALIPSIPVTDVTVGGTSVVSNGVAAITLPTVPTISTNVQTDKASDTKTSSPKSVYDEIHPNVVSSQPQGGFASNIFYDLSTISGSVTFALAAPTDANIVNHYYWTFDTGSTAPTITWPSGISWYGGSAPTISASKHYEVSIIDNIAICMEV